MRDVEALHKALIILILRQGKHLDKNICISLFPVSGTPAQYDEIAVFNPFRMLLIPPPHIRRVADPLPAACAKQLSNH